MPTAVVCAAFDAATDEAVYAVREIVRAAGVPLPPRPPHRPHFSLAAARVVAGDELEQFCAVAAGVAATHAPIDVAFDEVGRFGRAGVVWLGPAARVPALDTLQHDADAALRERWPRAFGERSDPRQWVAHCTLATRVPKPELRALQQRVRAGYQPIVARVDALAVILVGGRGDVRHVPLTG